MVLISLKIFDFLIEKNYFVKWFNKVKKRVVYNFLVFFYDITVIDFCHVGGIYINLKPTKILNQYFCSGKIWTQDFSTCSANISSQDIILLEF